MRLLRRLIAGIISLVLVIVLILLGVYIFVKYKYNIDLVQTVKELKTVNQPVDEEKLYDNIFSDEDCESMQVRVNASVNGLINNSSETGYTVDYDAVSSNLLSEIRLTDKQVGALASIIVKNQMGGKITFGEKEIPLELKQIKFNDIDALGNTTLNIVVKLDITSIKAGLKGFPYSYLKKYVPDYLYVSSTVEVKKEAGAFAYSVMHNAFTINNLSNEETINLFKTLNVVVKLGSAEDLNVDIGKTAMDALVGNETNNGFAYSLKPIGATDYNFETDVENNYFVVKM